MKALVVMLGVFFSISATAQWSGLDTFNSIEECRAKEKEYKVNYENADVAWMDCAAGVKGGAVVNCSGMDSYPKIETLRQLSAKRDNIQAEKARVTKQCVEMQKVAKRRDEMVDFAKRLNLAQETAERAHKPVQAVQPGIVNRAQNNARRRVNESTDNTLEETEKMQKQIKEFEAPQQGGSF